VNYITISVWQLGLAALLILINLGISIALRLGLERSLAIASVRMVVQLLLVGYVLEWIFALNNPILVVGISLFMASVAALAAINRTARRFARMFWSSFISILSTTFCLTSLVVIGILQVRPWYDPQYFIPLLGMVMGNALSGVSLGLDRFLEGLVSRQPEIETLLSLGATRWEAARGSIRDALRTGMLPTINSMMVVGLVSLPGMMTGQILAGADPLDAVRYQITIFFAIAAGTALATIIVVLLSFRSLFSSSHQLRLDRLQKK